MFKLLGNQLEIQALSPEESLGWRYNFGNYGYMNAFKSTILDEITKRRSVQRALGTAAFISCNTEVPAKKYDKEVPER